MLRNLLKGFLILQISLFVLYTHADTIAPLPPTIVSPGENSYTNVDFLSISGTGEADAIFEIYNDISILIWSWTVSSTGSWTYEDTGIVFPEWSTSIDVVLKDAFENSSSGSTLNYTIDTTSPVLSLWWVSPLFVQRVSAPFPILYTDQWVFVNDNAPHPVAVWPSSGWVYLTSSWKYTVRFDYTDQAWNQATPIYRTVYITSDPQKPIVELLWSASLTIEAGSWYIDAWAEFADNIDGTWSVSASWTVNTLVPWMYNLTYDYTDSSSNIANQKTRAVEVVDTTNPLITLSGVPVLFIEQWTSYTDAWASFSDIVDGTGSLVAAWSVDINTIWDYTLTYDYTDTATNAATQVSRLVKVVSSASDSDADNIPDLIEQAAPNWGDFNGDGQSDALQSDVTSAINPIVNKYIWLDLSTAGWCNTGSFTILAESWLASQDVNSFPLWLADFTLNCSSTGATADIKIYYDSVYDTSDWVYKKYNTNTATYTDISWIVSYTSENVGWNDVTVVNYSITDGGLYDEDGVANRVIVDPSGPSVTPPVSSSSWGWWGWWGGGSGSSSPKDVCPDGDFTKSSYDDDCGMNPDAVEENMEEEEDAEVNNEVGVQTENINNIEDEGDIITQKKSESSSCTVINNLLNPSYIGDYKTNFKDIEISSWKDEIVSLEKAGIVTGRSYGFFEPNTSITRAEFLAIALQTYCYRVWDTSMNLPFYDIDSLSWQSNVVSTALEKSIIKWDIDENGQRVFRPNDTITKMEAYAILMQLHWLHETDVNFTHGFQDSMPVWQHNYINILEQVGLVDSSEESLFLPNKNITRNEMVWILFWIIEK